MSTTTSRKPRATKATAAVAKPAAAAAATPAATSPRDDVTLDLDSLEREDRKEPFRFLHQDRVYEIVDPHELDWQDMLRAFGDPIFFLQHAMSKDDADAFFATKTPAWKLNKIQKAYQEHFGMPSLGE